MSLNGNFVIEQSRVEPNPNDRQHCPREHPKIHSSPKYRVVRDKYIWSRRSKGVKPSGESIRKQNTHLSVPRHLGTDSIYHRAANLYHDGKKKRLEITIRHNHQTQLAIKSWWDLTSFYSATSSRRSWKMSQVFDQLDVRVRSHANFCGHNAEVGR